MTKYKEWNTNGTVELLVGGTPCQSFSVAGLRKGLEDPRGNLALVYCGILDHFRPKWFIWENVPGVLSSNGGRDFGSFLGALAQLGYGFAYRVLDAQFFGVAQRRRRVFVVGYLGDWRPAATILFERKSLRRDTAPSREKGQVTPTLTKEGTGVSRPGHNEDGWYVAATLTKAGAGGQNFECGETYIPTTVGTLCADTHSGAYSGQDAYTGRIISKQAVRRLTPVECERLQGFPDNYTNIKENCPDGPRYKALGNSMAVPVMRWIGERIDDQR
jgi:DNA (cytosine-5)-methyltransferase 1